MLAEMAAAGFETPPNLRPLAAAPGGAEWLGRLPDLVDRAVERWALTLGPPFEDGVASFAAPATTGDGAPAVLKVQYPHRECEHEAEALRRWGGEGAVLLLGHDEEDSALLLERCLPGHPLSRLAGDDPGAALDVIIGLLPRLWVPADEPFTSAHDEAHDWAARLPDAWEAAGRPIERSLVDEVVARLGDLAHTQGDEVLIHQDLHGDNVLRAEREPWLAIDPKPLVGERELGLAPIIRSPELGWSEALVVDRLDRLTSELGLDRERARWWTIGQTLAWSLGPDGIFPGHLQAIRWLLAAA